MLPGLSPPFWLCSTLFSTRLLFLHQPHLLGRGALTHCPAFPANSYSSTGVQLKCPRESLPVSTILRGLCFPSESSPSWVGSFNLVSPTGLSLLENKGCECFTLLCPSHVAWRPTSEIDKHGKETNDRNTVPQDSENCSLSGSKRFSPGRVRSCLQYHT